MELFHIALQGILLGMTLSFVVGPALFSLIQTSINNGFKSGIFFAMGILISDLLMICLVYIGFSKLMETPKMRAIFSIIGGILLIIFGTYTFISKLPAREAKSIQIKQPFFGKYILKGFIFNIVNPSIWFYWLVPVGIASSYGNTQQTFVFLISMLLTIFSFDTLKCAISYKLKTIMTDKVVTVINKVVGVILIIIGIYLIIHLFDGVATRLDEITQKLHIPIAK